MKPVRFSAKSFTTIIVLVMVVVCLQASAQELPPPGEIPDTTKVLPVDSTKIPPPDSMTILPVDSLQIPPRDSMTIPPVLYQKYLSEDSVEAKSFMAYRIDNTIYTKRLANSVGDALRPHAGFDLVREGSYGQRSYLVFGALPIDRYKFGDYVFDYGQFALPVNGITDSRLISLAESAEMFYSVFSDPTDFHTPISYHPEYSDTGALSSAYMEKGNYGFSNTMVKFVSNAGERGRFGFTAGFKLSNGYLDNQKKDMENYRVFGAYQISENYQLQPDLAFYFTNDKLHFINDYANYRGESKSSFIGFTLALAAKEKSRLFSRTAFIFQRYSESVRGQHPKYRQESLDYRFEVENGLTISNWQTTLTFEPYYKNIEFEPEKNNYAGLDAYGFSKYDLLNHIDLNLAASLSLNKFANKDISIAGGINLHPADALTFSGQLFRITRPPNDFGLFANSPIIGLLSSASDSIHYSFHGDENLENTDYTGYSAGFKIKTGGLDWRLFAKQAEINKLTFWSQNLESATPYQRDANWLMGGAELRTVLPLKVDALLSYSYGRLRDANNGVNLAIVPRHKAFISLAKQVYIPKLGLDVNLNLEGEYHSENYKSPYNPATLGDYFLMNIKLQFKIKSLTIFYNQDNVAGKPYRTIYDYEIRRNYWWGFLWNFIN